MKLTLKQKNGDLMTTDVNESREKGGNERHRIYVNGSKKNISNDISPTTKVYKVSSIKDYVRKDGVVVSGHERVHEINSDAHPDVGIFISGKKPEAVLLRLRDKEKDEQYNPFYDKYKSFDELSRNEKKGEDYSIDVKKRNSDYGVLAPHGGNTEPGTTEIAKAIADVGGFNFYSLSSKKELDNTDLHLTSAKFDEPSALDIAGRSKYNITIHGTKDDENAVYLGGQNDKMGHLIESELKSSGFDVKRHSSKYLQGTSKSNIVNKGKSMDGGVQLELSRGLRKSMFDDISSASSREKTKNHVFNNFVNAVKTGISKYNKIK